MDPAEQIEPRSLQQIVYFPDMYGKYPEVRGRYYDSKNIRQLRNVLRAVIQRSYESRCGLDFLEDGAGGFPAGPLGPAQRAIMDFFALLERQAGRHEGLAQELRYHFLTTNDDFVIEAILDRMAGSQGLPFLNTYRGFTPVRIAGQQRPKSVPEHWAPATCSSSTAGSRSWKRRGATSWTITAARPRRWWRRPP